MSVVFADAFYWIALANRRDSAHQAVMQFTTKLAPRSVVTSAHLACAAASLVQFLTRGLIPFTLRRESQEFKAMTTIQLPDEQAAALEAKAAVEGLTLEAWLGKLAATEAPAGQARPRKGRYKLAELLAQCDPNAPLPAEDRAWLDAPAVGREAL